MPVHRVIFRIICFHGDSCDCEKIECVWTCFFTVAFIVLWCSATVFVKSTGPNLTVMRVDDMSMDKKDVLTAKYSLSGKACGVLAVGVY